MYKKFEINQTKMKGGCESGRKVVAHNSKSDLPQVLRYECDIDCENKFGLLFFVHLFKKFCFHNKH